MRTVTVGHGPLTIEELLEIAQGAKVELDSEARGPL
jgi:hypothetical protein